MYPASADFISAIKSEARHIHWSGSINFDTPITFNENNILSCNISKKISGQKLSVGTVHISQITAELILPSVSRYELYGKNITVSGSVEGASDVIPMGIFTITKATQTADHISITGYDAMSKFEDVNFSVASKTNIQLAYAWLSDACTACGVVLGSTSADIQALPNGNRKTGIADVVTDIKTWRDVLAYLGAYLGAYSYIGRDGKLYLGQYKSAYDDTVPASFRGSSNLSDYRTTYDGIYGVHKESGTQEYVANENTDGLVLDLGVNPFLQFTDQTNRLAALQEIIDAWNGIYYVPYNAEMPLIPTYDAGDVLRFVDKQAGEYDIGVITEIVYNLAGSMTIKCSGDNPKLTAAQDRFTKTIAGLSAEYNNGQQVGGKGFWLLMLTNEEQITVSSTEIQIAEIEYNQTTYGQRLAMILTIDAVLSATAVVKVRVNVDDETDLEMKIEEKKFGGERGFYCSNPQKVYGTGIHRCKVYMTVTDSPTTVGELY